MKKRIALLLCIAMLVSLTGAVASEHITFSGSRIETMGVQEFNDDAVYDKLNEMFNFTLDMYPVTWDNWAQKTNMWIAGGDMPDVTFWNFKYIEYLNYVDQGLVKALPDGWQEKYPNIANMVEATGIADYIEIDGKTYCVPHSTFLLFAPMSEQIWNKSVYVRKDWAEQVGMTVEAGQLVSLEWLGEYITKVQEADLAGNGNTIGLCGAPGDIARIFCFEQDINIGSPFIKEEGQYVWSPTQENTISAIKTLRSWYEQKLIDPDFYLSSNTDARNKLYSGLSAAMIEDGTIANVVARQLEFEAANPGMKFVDCVANVALCNENGEWGGYSSGNYWGADLYNPNLDDDTFDRILTIQDFCCSKEGQLLINMGLEGSDWEYAADGSLKILRPANEDGSYTSIRNIYPSVNYYRQLGVLADDFSFVDPSTDPSIVANTTKLYQNKSASTIRDLFDPYAEFFNSESKAQYSVDISAEIVREVVTADIDVETEWAKFIETNRPMWEPVVNDMNAGLK